ncbi:MAG: chemotaxis protein CheR, partial [Desulfohalobiaceae bacterium]|nr:chemotaxis protein CheR [Desulfohalobiaceae bacterium]
MNRAAGTGTSVDPEATAQDQDSNISKDSSLSETGLMETTSSKAEPEPESPAEPGTASAEGSASPESEASASREDKPLPLLVGIGASAGGLEAMSDILDHLNGGDCLTLFIVQHQASQSDKQTLSNLLGKHTKHKVCLARDGETYQPGRIYVTPPDKELSLYDGRMQLTERERGARSMIIDAFFRSLALERPGRSVAVILSGSNTDGTLGARAVKERNGLVIAQDPQSAGFPTMPQSIVDEGLADVILKPSQMVEHIISFAENLRLVPTNERDKLFMLLKNRTGHDFSKYKDNTVNRRIQRRMAVHRIDRLKDYVSYIRRNRDEAEHLFRDLLIGVTNFFRDFTVFEGLKELLLKEYLPRLSNSQFRAWVPGCATGEEAYSLAIILTEILDELDADIEVVIYGTDLDEAAVDQARKGIFPKNIEADVSSERIKRFFEEEEVDGRYRIKQDIREMLVFAVHNVTSDPPFSRLNLVCCRNLLMYLKPEAQKSVLSQFRYGLVDDGLLLLGTSESVTVLAQPFATVDKKLRLYRLKPGAGGVLCSDDQALFRHRTTHAPSKRQPRRQDAAEPSAGNIKRAAERFLLEMSEPSVLVDKTGDILYFHGRSGRYLEPVKGRPQSNILEMARTGLSFDLSAALTMAAAKKKAQVRTGVKVKTNDHEEGVDLFVRPLDLEDREEPCFMISFQKSQERKPPDHGEDIQNYSNGART